MLEIWQKLPASARSAGSPFFALHSVHRQGVIGTVVTVPRASKPRLTLPGRS